MKLRNKKTGEIGYTAVLRSKVIVVMDENAIQLGSYTSLAELNAEWEDYEEPKEYWYINASGEVNSICEEDEDEEDTKSCEEIGNYFSSREEAELAVRKLKAWKRLKDRGFKLKGWYMPKNTLNIEIDGGFPEDVSLCDVMDDLDIFGGEE